MATHLLEAVMVVTILSSAIIFVGNFERSSTPLSAIEEAMLAPHVMDLLKIAHEMPSKSCGAHDQLEQLIVEGASGQHDLWNQRVSSSLGPGVESGMVLDNLHGTYALHGDTNMMGSTRDLTIMPDFGQPTSIVTTPATGISTMSIDVPSARSSELVRLKGDAIRTTIQTTDLTGTRSYQTWSPTAILGNDPRDGIQDIGWNMTTGRAGSWNFTKTVNATNLTYYAQNVPDTFSLHFNGTSGPTGVRVPAKTSVQIDFPRGWSLDDTVHAGWSSRVTNRLTGATLTLVAPQDIVAGSDIAVLAHPPASPARPFDIIRAHAFNGSFGESSLLVQYPVVASPDLPRQVFPTTPYPVRPGTMALFGASFANGGTNTTVTQLDFEIPGGYDVWMNRGAGAQIFDDTHTRSPVGVDGHGGSWSVVDARHARWTSDPARPVVVPALAVAWWGAELPITSRADQTTSIEPLIGMGPRVELSFNAGTFNASSTAWGKSPGIISVPVANMSANRNDGYNFVDRSFSTTVTSARAYQYADGMFDVDTTNAGSTDGAAANSTFTVQDRRAPLGSLARVDADFESVMNKLSNAGITDSNLTIDLFAPPNFGCAPTHSWKLNGKSLPRPAVRALAFADIAGAGSPDAIIGIADHKLYRINAQGVALWTTSLSSTAQRIAYWDGGLSDRAILAGDDTGMLSKLDASTGTVAWSVCVGAATCDSITTSARGVTSISVDVTVGRIVTTTADGRLTVLDTEGGVTAHRGDDGEGSYTFAGFLRTGNIVAQNDAGGGALEQLDIEDLEVLQSRVGHWFASAAGAQHTLHIVQLKFESTIDDLTFQQTAPDVSFTSTEAVSTASGDANGDGVPELVVAMNDKSVWVFDGSTNALGVYNTPLIAPPRLVPPIGPLLAPLVQCMRTDITADWDPPTCALPPDTGTLDPNAPAPLLAVGSAGIVEEFEWRGEARVTVLDARANPTWTRYMTIGHSPTALASGKWGVADTIGIAYDDGITEAWPITPGPIAPTHASSPSTVAGKFTLTFPIPSGGFYGSHLLVANLSWIDTSGAAKSVRLTDWLEVVAPDGTPVAHPTYRAVIIFGPRDAPMTRR